MDSLFGSNAVKQEEYSAGSAIAEDSQNEVENEEVDAHLDRYVISPLYHIPLTDMNMTGAMSIGKLIARRINRLKDVVYKIRDNSAEALLDTSRDIDKMPLINTTNTAASQERYLTGGYGDRGVIGLDYIKGRSPREVVAIEEVIIPEYFQTLIGFYGFISSDEPEDRIKKSDLSAVDKKIAKKIIAAVRESCLKAGEYAQTITAESKSEIVNSRNGKAGKSSLDGNDHFLHDQTGIPKIQERDIQYAATAEVAKETGNEKLAEAILKLAESSAPKTNEIQELKDYIKNLEAKMDAARAEDTVAKKGK